jgi:NADPH:quinone reductase
MKAIRVYQTGGPEVLKLEDVPEPGVAMEQVLVEIKAIGVNPVEAYIRSGMYPLRSALPYTPGGDAAGIIQSIGPEVKHLKVGDRVYTAGTLGGAYAQFALCESSQVHPLPENMSYQQGAAVNVPYATAWRAIYLRAKAMAGETVLVHGASGGVGIAAVQILKAAAMTIFGTAGTERGLRLVAEQGADHVLDHTQADYQKKLLDLTGGRGLDLILEMLANVNLNGDLGLLAKGGRVVVIGSRGPVQIDARLTMVKDSDIRGMSLMNATAEELRMIHAALVAGLANGTLRPVINCELPLGQAPKAHELVMSPGAYGKIVLIP